MKKFLLSLIILILTAFPAFSQTLSGLGILGMTDWENDGGVLAPSNDVASIDLSGVAVISKQSPIENVLYVDSLITTDIEGYSYDTIQEAIDYVTGKTGKWQIFVSPSATYTESLVIGATMPETVFAIFLPPGDVWFPRYVSLVAAAIDEYAITITSCPNTVCFYGFYVGNASAAATVGAVLINDSSLYFNNCYIASVRSGSNINELIETSMSSMGKLLKFTDCFINAGNCNLAIDWNDSLGASSIHSVNTWFYGDNDAACYVLDAQSVVSFFYHKFINCTFEKYPKVLPSGINLQLRNCVLVDGSTIGDGTVNDSFLAKSVSSGIIFNDYALVKADASAVSIRNVADSAYLDVYAKGVTLSGVVGIDVTPGSDIDTDLITVNVTDTPRLFWDESEDMFQVTKGLYTPAINLGDQSQLTYTGNARVNCRNAANDGYVPLYCSTIVSSSGQIQTDSANLLIIADNDADGAGAVYLKTDASTTAALLQEGGDLTLYGATGDPPNIYYDLAADASVVMMEVEYSGGNYQMYADGSNNRFYLNKDTYIEGHLSMQRGTVAISSTPIGLTAGQVLGQIYSNDGADRVVNLPVVSAGYQVTFVCISANNFDINPDDSDIILGLTDTAGDAIRGAAVGASVTLIGLDSVNWAVKSYYGVWNDIN